MVKGFLLFSFIWFESVLKYFGCICHEPSKTNILKVYNEIEKNQIFGTKEIEEILACSPSTARAVMAKLRDMGVVIVVKGKGKGKYVFKE